MATNASDFAIVHGPVPSNLQNPKQFSKNGEILSPVIIVALSGIAFYNYRFMPKPAYMHFVKIMSCHTQKLQPDMPVSRAARILLAGNLQEVQQRLELAAKHADDDIEHVHQLRVSTRRSIAALDLFREFLPSKKRRRLATQLKKIRNVAAKARDLDVLICQQINNGPTDEALVKHLRKKREKAQNPILKTYARAYTDGELQRLCEPLLKTLAHHNGKHQPDFRHWSQQKLPELISAFLRRQPGDNADLGQLHRFRIAAKKFRYALDLLKLAFPANAFPDAQADLKRLQNILGKINDRYVAIQRIRRLKAKGVKVQKHVLKNEIARLQSVKRKFAKWWTAEVADGMKHDLLGD